MATGGSTKDILERSKTVAVVGMSRDVDKPAGRIPLDLQRHGFHVIPVNPSVDEILGEKAYAELRDVPDQIDIVEVFRPAEEAPGVAHQAMEVGAKVLWLQLGIRSDEARRTAEEAGMAYIEDRCMGAEAAALDISKSGLCLSSSSRSHSTLEHSGGDHPKHEGRKQIDDVHAHHLQ